MSSEIATPTASDHVASLVNQPTNLFNRLSALAPVEQVDIPAEILHRKLKRGRTVGRSNVPLSQQILIGIAARTDGTTKAAREFGVSPTTADGYMDGSTQQGKKDAQPNPVLKPALDAVINKTKNMVVERIMGSIKSIEVLDNGKVRGLDPDRPQAAASLAHTLSGVIEKLSPKEQGSGNRVQVIVYGPEERNESQYESIDVPLMPEER